MRLTTPRKSSARDRPRTQAKSARAGRHQVSLERALSKLGFASRSAARRLITTGQVNVNGRACRNPRARVDPRSDRLSISGAAVRPSKRIYILLHKPVGVVTSRADERGRETVYNLLPGDLPWVFPVGRLDKESSGAILLTNDTRVGDLLTSPSHHVEKTYRVTLDRPLNSSTMAEFRKGRRLFSGERLLPIRVTPVAGPAAEYEFILSEGKNRQIRRMCEEAGYSVRSLHRTAIGPLELGPLPPAKFRLLAGAEITALFSGRAERGSDA